MLFLKQSLRLRLSFTALLFVAGPPALAQSVGKIPPNVIDYAASDSTVLALVDLNVPWRMESLLSEDAIQALRGAVVSVRTHELARSESVANVLLDRPMKPGQETIGDAWPRELTVVNASSMPQEKVPRQLFSRAANNGTVLVLAGLRVPWQREDNLSEELMTLQRGAILDAQRYILAELSGTKYRVTRLYRKIPGIALRVGPDALKVLERSTAITNVLPDRAPNPSH